VADFFDEGCYKDYIWVNRDRLLNDYSYRCAILRGVARKGFTTAIQPSYAREYHWGDSIIRASRAGKRIGSSGNLGNTAWWQKKIADRFYTRLIPARREVLFEFIRNREFFETLLGTPIPFTKPDLPASSISVPLSIKERYAVIAPGGSTENKRWTTAGFGQVARYLNGKYGLTIVIAGGPLEGEISSAVADSANVPGCIVIAGQTSIAQLAKYLSGAAILVSNDSTAVHLSVAVNTPVVQLLNGAHFGRFGPYPADVFGRTRSVFPPEIAGQMRNNIPFEVLGKRYEASVPLDIKSIKLQDVIMAIDSLLQSDKSCGF
jgi:ADP-heptose:LPS heptosyltransferase